MRMTSQSLLTDSQHVASDNFELAWTIGPHGSYVVNVAMVSSPTNSRGITPVGGISKHVERNHLLGL